MFNENIISNKLDLNWSTTISYTCDIKLVPSLYFVYNFIWLTLKQVFSCNIPWFIWPFDWAGYSCNKVWLNFATKCLILNYGTILNIERLNLVWWFSNLQTFIKTRVVVPGKPFQHSLMFAGKAGVYPSEPPFRFSTLG
jgi:hypothetical protein